MKITGGIAHPILMASSYGDGGLVLVRAGQSPGRIEIFIVNQLSYQNQALVRTRFKILSLCDGKERRID